MYSCIHFFNIYPKKSIKHASLKNHKKNEENITTESMPTSSASPVTSSHEHDTTLYSPITTIQTTAEIITSASEPSTTVSSLTTTPRIVDATIAHVVTMVDKVEHKILTFSNSLSLHTQFILHSLNDF